jgi:hypothetical protein
LTAAGRIAYRGHPPPGLGPIPARQIRQRRDGVAIAPLDEHTAAHQIGHDPDNQPIELSPHAFAHRQRGQRLVRRGGRTGGLRQRIDRLDHEGVCGNDRGARHSIILLELKFDSHSFPA